MEEMIRLLSIHVLILLLITSSAVSNYGSSAQATSSSINNTLIDNNNLNSSTNLTLAPSIFPKNDSDHHFVDNSTILHNLILHNSLLDNNTEADDMRHGGEYSKMKIEKEKLNNLLPEKNSPPPPPPVVNFNGETELIEDGSNTEDKRINKSSREIVDENYNRKSHGSGVPIVQGQLAAILAGVFVVLSIIGYVGLLSWRRFLENRYGNREMLVNEDDFNDPRDLGHFSL